MAMPETKKFAFYPVLILLSILCCSCSKTNSSTLAEELPMYGGRARTAKEKEKDSLFIQEAIKEAGSREAALKNLIKSGFEYFRQGDPQNATKKFNQAWLMAPDNADVFWGFGNVLGVQGNIDQAIDMLKKATKLSPQHIRAMSDLAYAYQQKAYYLRDTQEKFTSYLDKSDKIFAEANKIDPKYELCYSNWAITLYLQGRFNEAWEKIGIARQLGGRTVDREFVQRLSLAMPEPDK